MSMLLVQIDELRTMAQLEKSLERPAIARILGDAADTICELRGALQVASVDYRQLADENAKLRELCADLYAEMLNYSRAPHYNASVWAVRLREQGVEVTP